MRKRNSGGSHGGASPESSDDDAGSDPEDSILASHPDEEALAFQDGANRLKDEILHLHCTSCLDMVGLLKQGKVWWVQCITIYIAALLTYSYNNAGDDNTNVQIAIMTVITLVGATPFASTHLIPAAIGAFVGGQNIIGSTGSNWDDNNVIYASNYLWLFLLSSIVGLVWCFVINSNLKILDGYAGRLGTATFIGMNLAMVMIYGPAGVVDWDRYYYGFKHIIHVGEEDSSHSLASAWEWTEEAEAAIGYVLSVLWLGVVAGGTRIIHNRYVQKIKSEPLSTKRPPAPLNNVLVPVIWALLSMLVVNATQYKHAPALYNGFAVGSYVAMASLQKISSILKFAFVSLLAAGWGLTLTPFFVGFAGKSGFTSMLGHVTFVALEKLFRRFQIQRKRRQEELRLQLEQLQLEMQEQHQAMQAASKNDDFREQQEAPPSSHQHHHKPKKDTFYTKQQRRQQHKLKHLREQEGKSQEEQQAMQDPPTLHHRAWSALPVEGDGVWQHSLETREEPNSIV